jgi:glycosyltransferase involved in cell wall biosynthesis
MVIGLDLASLQGPHRMRGIGFTLINFINNLPADLRSKHQFVFYLYEDSHLPDPLELLSLDKIDYEVRALAKSDSPKASILPGKLKVLSRLGRRAINSLFPQGDKRIKNLVGVDVFLQTDQMIPLPRAKGIRTAFIAYDLIPYILESDYLWGYKTARRHRLPIQAAIRCQARRYAYLLSLKRNAKSADLILSISDATKSDFIKHIPSCKTKIKTVPLGADASSNSQSSMPPSHRYLPTSWGYIKKPYEHIAETPFLLFVGGADKRRRLDELVIAFNHLRAQNIPLKLVLAGDSMQGPRNISTVSIQEELLRSSYIDDIIFLGFVDDAHRNWLYRNTLSFVFPSMYEGFGLPVLEAFSYGSPVIAYPNEATKEVAGDHASFASNYVEIMNSVKNLSARPDDEKNRKSDAAKKQAAKYSWCDTARNIITYMEGII